jgi:aminoglycoside 6-adenylyltransferase
LSGSYAQARPTADELSDLDIALYVTDIKPLAESDGWMNEIAGVWMYLPLFDDDGHHTRLVIFEGGRKVDFMLLPASTLEAAVQEQPLSDVFARGYKVLVDKDGLAAKLPSPTYRAPSEAKPSQEEFTALVEEFWFEAYHVAKYIARDDLWAVKFRDWTTKELLLKMIEWYEKSTHGWNYDTWHIGVRMKRWAEPEIWERLHETFAHFEGEDSSHALRATMALFRELAEKTATRLGYRYPAGVDKNLSGYVTSMLGN